MNISQKIAEELRIKNEQVENTINLIDEGNTIPFIARYRKEATGGLSDVLLRELETKLNYLRNLEERKEEVIRLIDEQEKLTPELEEEIRKAEVLQRVEDLYKPYKQKKATRASKAKAKGLEPLAMQILAQKEEPSKPTDDLDAEGPNPEVLEIAKAYVNEEKEVLSAEEALQGALDIIAEIIADDPELIKEIRSLTKEAGVISTEAQDPEEKTVYDMYYEFAEAINKIANHRVLAINRGENEKKLKVKLIAPVDDIISYIQGEIITNEKSIYVQALKDTIDDSYKRLIAPSVEREMRNMLTERAEEEAVKVFAKNTEKLLMVPPVKGKRIISIDPGYRTGCKVAVINETGKLLAYTTIYPTEPKNDVAGTEKILKECIEKFDINVIVIGNGTASRETEEVVANFLKKNDYDVQYTIVNEAGASVYSASKLATEEYPNLDVTTRGAMSLGRRLQDPLAELVKISPKSIGVGQYQHDINQKLLEEALGSVVEDCVNRVGVDLNTASPSLLSYIAGINMGVAKNIVAYREENGEFVNRKQLLKVPKLGQKAFEQCAGFMRIAEGENPFDSTSVHPESYEVAEKMLEKVGLTTEAISTGGAGDMVNRIKLCYSDKTFEGSVKQMAEELGVGEMTLTDIIKEIEKPARDPRDDAPPVIFRNDVKRFEDLKVDMELTGTVRNVVDFGAFVDIGIKNDGLVHISELSDKYVKHPMDVVNVGDTVKVKIIKIDYDKERVGLSMKGMKN